MEPGVFLYVIIQVLIVNIFRAVPHFTTHIIFHNTTTNSII